MVSSVYFMCVHLILYLANRDNPGMDFIGSMAESEGGPDAKKRNYHGTQEAAPARDIHQTHGDDGRRGFAAMFTCHVRFSA